MADLFQGQQLDPTVSTIQKQQTSPEFYTNYLQNITNLGQNAVANSGVAGMSPLQMQAMNLAPTAAFSGSGTMGAGANLAASAGTTSAPSIVGQYMNPYVSNVVDELGRKQQQDIQRNVMPGLSAAGAATGNFGSKRQAVATGQTLADMQSNLLGQQYNALNTGYNTAMTNAQSDLNRELQAGQAMGNIGAQQGTLGQSGLTSLANLGATQRGIAQEALNYPMAEAQNYAKLLQGYNIPTGETQQTTSSGAYTNSPLANIAGIVALLNSYNNGGINPLQEAQIKQANAMADFYTGQNKKADGGSISMADGGVVNPINSQVYNDAAGGNTYTYADGGYVYDQYGNMIG